MKTQNAKMTKNEGPQGQNERKLENCGGHGAAQSIVRTLPNKEPKCKEMKLHKAKMKGNEGPQRQNARK